jgi:hypothetical protein
MSASATEVNEPPVVAHSLTTGVITALVAVTVP